MTQQEAAGQPPDPLNTPPLLILEYTPCTALTEINSAYEVLSKMFMIYWISVASWERLSEN